MRGVTIRLLVLTLTVLVWLTAGTAVAQVGQGGAITGTVKDSAGLPMPGVTVTAVNQATNVTVTAVSNGAGVYLVPALVPGNYKITLTIEGFATEARLVEVRSGDRLQVDVALKVGTLSEQVTVVAETPLLETASASRITTIDSASVQELPLSGRNPFVLPLVTPGVTGAITRASLSYRPFDNGGMDTFSINGGRNRSNEYMLDGAPNSNNEGTGGNTLSFVPSPDAVQAVSVQTNTYDAQYGRTGGGVMSVTLKSGTNTPHGSGYYYLRNSTLNSNLYENIVAGLPKSDVYHRQPGFTFGGPVWLPKVYNGTDKTFFFYSYEHITSQVPNGVSQKAPTDLERAGNFSQSLNGIVGGLVYDPLTGLPFPGNVIPAGRINPVSQALLKYMPQPNTTPDSAGNNFSVSPNSRGDTYDSNLVRLDHSLGDTRIAVRLAHNGRHETRSLNGREEVASPGGGNGGNHYRWNDQISGDLNSVFSKTLVSSLKIGWTRHTREDRPAGEGTDIASLLPYSPAYMNIAPDRFLQIGVTDYSGAGVGDSSGGFRSLSDQFFATEVLTKISGRHTLKAGGEFRRFTDANLNANQGVNTSSTTFNRNWTSQTPTVVNPGAAAGGNAFASFLLGYPAFSATNANAGGTTTRYSDAYQNWESNYLSAFVQDDWRLTDKWMLNLGLRWDYEAPVSERNDLSNFGFDPNATSPLQVAGLPTLKGGLLFGEGQVFGRDYNNFGPRVGTTYRISEKLVARAGYGLTYLPSVTDRGTLFGFSQVTPIVASTDGGRTPAVTLSNPYPTGFVAPSGSAKGLSTSLGQNISYTVHDRPIPEYNQWSVGVQYQLPWRSVIDVAYVGSKTNKLSVSQPINDLNADQLALGDTFLNAQVPNPFAGLLPDAPAKNGATVQRRELMRPYPQFGTINETLAPIGYLSYSALQTTWNKRMSHGVHFLVSYTYSSAKEASIVLNQGEGVYEQYTNQHRPHVLQLSGGWQMPAFADKNAFVRYALGGWQINTVTAIRSGVPVNMPGGVKLIGDPVIANQTRARWFNTCTLTATGVRQNCASADEQPAFQILPANALRVEGSRLEGVMVDEPINIDFSFFKTFPIQKTNLQFRAELFNAMNVVQMGGPNTTATSNQFGTISNVMANDPRNIMVSIRFTF